MRLEVYLRPNRSNLNGMDEKSDGAVAQLVEQRTENPCVPGSSPGGATSPQRKLRAFYLNPIRVLLSHLLLAAFSSRIFSIAS